VRARDRNKLRAAKIQHRPVSRWLVVTHSSSTTTEKLWSTEVTTDRSSATSFSGVRASAFVATRATGSAS